MTKPTVTDADKALDKLIDAACQFTDGYVPDAIRVLEAIFAVPNGIQSIQKLPSIGRYLRRRRREFT